LKVTVAGGLARFAAATGGRGFPMNSTIENFAANDESILYFEVSDDALEAAADTLKNPAFSMPNAPTVSILFSCCGTDVSSGVA
jgi:hypothetical protein